MFATQPSFSVDEKQGQKLSGQEQNALLEVVCHSTCMALATATPFQPIVDSYAMPLRRRRASFVSLGYDEQLISCAGTVRPIVPLVSDVSHNAYEAVSHAVSRLRQLPALAIDVALISSLSSVRATCLAEVLSALDPKQHGVLLEYEGGDATFTPDKWKKWPEKSAFIRQLCIRAGIADGNWSPDIRLWTYTVLRLPRLMLNN